MTPVIVESGDGPVILAMPHGGTWVPPETAAALNDRGRMLADTDWHIDRLYAGLLPGATVVRATFHRYVIDPNRDPAGKSLYPGQTTTDLVPQTDFDGAPIWTARAAGTLDDPSGVVARFHAPYHAALAAAVARTRACHGVAILYDCHSIRSRIPHLFDGILPDLCIGDFDGRSCDATVTRTLRDVAAASRFSHVVNGRFRGGWTTRTYGRPAEGVHAIQMELAQSTYLATEAPPFAYDPARADGLRPVLADILGRLDALARSGALT